MVFPRGLALSPVLFGLRIVLAVSVVCPFVAEERPTDSQSGLSSPGSSWSVPGQVVLGGLFPLHDSAPDRRSLRDGRPEQLICTSVILEGFQWAMTMLFAIREINMNTNILPNATLGYEVHDTCFSIPRTITIGLGFMQGKVDHVAGAKSQYCPHAVIGPYASKVTDVLSMALGLFLIPQVSFGAGCNCFSDKKRFPSFVHTYHSYATFPLTYSNLIRHFHWTFIGIMAVEDIYNWDLMANLRTELESHGYCVAFMEVLPQHYGPKELDSFASVVH
uniref:extracellular calcium-sensing receptor-like isoform X5 n=1 Tax=Myxine glutinosa TaxID=7769 RepID=UPI00358ECA7C